MLPGKGLKIFDGFLFFLRLRGRDNKEYMLTPRTTNLCSFGRDPGFIQVELGQAGGAGNNHQ
jgi:hypothetical protein